MDGWVEKPIKGLLTTFKNETLKIFVTLHRALFPLLHPDNSSYNEQNNYTQPSIYSMLPKVGLEQDLKDALVCSIGG